MYNTDLPRRADLPSSAQLSRSTIIAAASACVLLVTIVLPSEYAIDPTGVGRMMGLTQMGEIKAQLAAEAKADSAAAAPSSSRASSAAPDQTAVAPRLERIEAPRSPQQQSTPSRAAPAVQSTSVAEPNRPPAAVANSVPAPEPAKPAPASVPVAPAKPVAATAAGRSDEVSFTLTPGQGAEIKLVMRQGARASFTWTSSGGPVNFDKHGDAPGQSTSYEKGRNVVSDNGVLEAAFDGNHGWFWRNRASAPVTVTLRTSGDYKELKRLL